MAPFLGASIPGSSSTPNRFFALLNTLSPSTHAGGSSFHLRSLSSQTFPLQASTNRQPHFSFILQTRAHCVPPTVTSYWAEGSVLECHLSPRPAQCLCLHSACAPAPIEYPSVPAHFPGQGQDQCQSHPRVFPVGKLQLIALGFTSNFLMSTQNFL